jgi:signal transduction histidine kinase/CheY-like chemotaxis protein
VFRLSFRYLLALALIVVNLGLAAVVATFAYHAAHDALVRQALQSVTVVAQGRARELDDVLERRQRRLEGFLDSLENLCGERRTNGEFGFEEQCLRSAVGGLYRSELATTIDLSHRERLLTHLGGRAAVAPPFPGQLARIEGTAGQGLYAMRATRGSLAVDALFDLDDLNVIFQDRAGLEANGEAFLTDNRGYRLTAASFAIPSGFPVQMAPIVPCLDGAAQAIVTTDYRGINVISGARPSPATGGGCIVTNVQYDDATKPVERLGWLLAYASGLIGLVGGVLSMVVAGFVTRPIKRLAAAARALGEGNLDVPVPVSGPSEVRQLALTLSRMTSSIRDLVRSEQRARREAEAASRTKDDFLATLSHELRTPLNAILGWASILSRTDRDRSRVMHAVRVIERNARVQSQMIEELLDVSRIAAGRVRLSVSNVPIAGAVDAAFESVRPAAEAKGVHLRKQIDVDTETVRADPRRLQQIIWNLLSNAVRFTPGGGQVSVVARGERNGVEIVVTDTGSGIAPEFLPHIFDRFRQGDSSTTRAHGGLGLGLAIVRDLLELHGGTVRADSPGEGRGATFTVWLPEKGSIDDDVADGHRVGQLPSRLAGAKVLIVDDDPDARDVLRTILEDAGASVRASASASETRRMLLEARPDMLIADIGMPEEDGYSLIQSIRRLDTDVSHVPAIALTAHTQPEDIERALRSGFQMHMAKPIDSARLIASVAALFDAAR